jgi:hypothetical protein
MLLRLLLKPLSSLLLLLLLLLRLPVPLLLRHLFLRLLLLLSRIQLCGCSCCQAIVRHWSNSSPLLLVLQRCKWLLLFATVTCRASWQG